MNGQFALSYIISFVRGDVHLFLLLVWLFNGLIKRGDVDAFYNKSAAFIPLIAIKRKLIAQLSDVLRGIIRLKMD
ncbi:hypothetical protein Q4493_00810 [Colwellia sp. 1_MG-2023]|uniref:hypothetical protein n=1 Tax=Colwellia sp. 1_MG-2023 TaxID=3062649 RepID=UPI0026E35885|nr:hypothetical protein [Colwellia sp. 1_MG-2023]MDO6444303.1 hypothetical protein [Colwellia sp. 1_MG-2023]